MLHYITILLSETLMKQLNLGNDAFNKKVCQKIVHYCAAWGIGSHLDDLSLPKFKAILSGFFKSYSDGPKGDIFDNYLCFDTNIEGEFIHF